MRLNFGMFVVHMVQMAMFLMVPLSLVQVMDLPVARHWTLYFPIVQECPDGVTERWIEIPAAGQSADDLELPAPGVKLLEAVSGH